MLQNFNFFKVRAALNIAQEFDLLLGFEELLSEAGHFDSENLYVGSYALLVDLCLDLYQFSTLGELQSRKGFVEARWNGRNSRDDSGLGISTQ